MRPLIMMSAAIATAMLCGAFVTTSASAMDLSGMPQHRRNLLAGCGSAVVNVCAQCTERGGDKCIKCRTFNYGLPPGSTTCEPCANKCGPASPSGDTARCNPNAYNPSNGDYCKSCGDGYSTPTKSPGYCEPCSPGSYSKRIGASKFPSCRACSAGQYQDKEAQSSCNDCPVGQYSTDEGTVNCLGCSGNTYQDMTGQTSCQACPDNSMVSKPSATKRTDCVCKDGYYYSGGACKECSCGTTTTDTKGKCDPTNGMCTSCPPGYQPNKATGSTGAGMMCESCTAGATYSLDGKECIMCDTNCAPANQTPKTCTTTAGCTTCKNNNFKANPMTGKCDKVIGG